MIETRRDDAGAPVRVGNYRQHITFASVLGVVYAWAASVFAGIPWLYGTVAALLVTLGGLLPDLDSPTGVHLRGFTGILGVLTALAVWQRLSDLPRPPVFELHLWAVVLTFLLVRHGVRRLMTRISVHRGIFHSVPACAVWGALAYLYYPSDSRTVRVTMAFAVMAGVFSHLFLDEFCSVNLANARVNRAFGTALKFWARSPFATFAVYALLSVLAWKVIQDWPRGGFLLDPPPAPDVPFDLRGDWRRLRAGSWPGLIAPR